MSYYSPSIEKLIEAFEKLPSIGSKTAARLAFHILDASEQETNEFRNTSGAYRRWSRRNNICRCICASNWLRRNGVHCRLPSEAVSYTHLDVYKRQTQDLLDR